MKKLFTACLVLMATAGFAQKLTVYNKDGKWGWKDEKGKKVVIEAQYQAERGFDEESGLGTVQMNGKWGMIDKTGKTVVPFEYDDFGRMQSNGWISAKKGGKYGFIDKTGKEVMAPKYDVIRTSSMGEMYFVKSGGKWGMMTLEGKEITEIKYDNLSMIGMKPYKYRGTANGQATSISFEGVEEVALGADQSSSSSSDKKDAGSTKKKHLFTCQGCGNTEIMEGSSRPSPNKTHCRSPKVKNSTSHSWDYTKEIK